MLTRNDKQNDQSTKGIENEQEAEEKESDEEVRAYAHNDNTGQS